jgi:hypothetical protein
VILIAGLYFLFRSTEITHPPGILAPDSPIQEKIYKINAWIKDNFQFTPIKTFETSARVLSIKFYSNDDMSEFCPVDLALGWNRMSDQMIIDNLEIKQQHRWYVWRADFLKIPVKEVEISSSNVHVIPANEKIENILDDIVNGNIIKIKGKLVNVNKIGNNFTWKTSTKRDDTGGGACEILWTEELTILK